MAHVVLAVGDMAGPTNQNAGSADTARLMTELVTRHPDALVLVLGDNAYNDGETDEYDRFYTPFWGIDAIASRVRSCPGNHDYHSSNALPYFAHFGDRAGPADRRGYYSFDWNGWHIVSLNTERDFDEGSPQLSWLDADLREHAAMPTLAFFHRPRFGSGGHGDSDNAEAIWETLFNHRVEIALNGHAHHYERFAPQRPDRTPDPAATREFIVGTGGRGLVPPKEPGRRKPNSEAASGDTFGVLKLTLAPTAYEWEFVPTAGGGGFTDRSAAPHPTNR